MEASEPKCVNSLLDIIGVNSLRLGGLQLYPQFKSNRMGSNLFTLEWRREYCAWIYANI